MTVRTVCNQTARSTKRQVETQAFEVWKLTGEAIGGENHIHLVNYDGGALTAWFYPGYKHLPCSTTQSGTTPA
jgi:hypothetical protein